MLDAATGVLGGTPQVLLASTVFVVTAANDGGTTTAELTLVVDVPPRDLSYEVPARLVKGAGIEAAPTVAGGPVTQFRVEPALPSNLTLDAATGLLAGTPDALVGASIDTVFPAVEGGDVVSWTVAPPLPAQGPRAVVDGARPVANAPAVPSRAKESSRRFCADVRTVSILQ